MKKYYLTDGLNNFGPFSLDELRQKNITKESNIWFEGLQNWEQAGSIPELNELFKSTPPPLNRTFPPPTPNINVNQNIPQTTNISIPPKSWLVESILATILCCLPFGIVGIINASKVESRFNTGDIEGSIRASNEAKKWTTIAFGIGIAWIVLYFIFVLFGFLSLGSLA